MMIQNAHTSRRDIVRAAVVGVPLIITTPAARRRSKANGTAAEHPAAPAAKPNKSCETKPFLRPRSPGHLNFALFDSDISGEYAPFSGLSQAIAGTRENDASRQTDPPPGV